MLGLHRVIEEWQSSHIHIKETSDHDSPRKAPKIKASLNIRGANRRNLLPRGKLQVVSAPHLPSQPVGGQLMPSLQPVRFLRSKGSICLNQTLSPESHRICTRSCTSLRNSVQPWNYFFFWFLHLLLNNLHQQRSIIKVPVLYTFPSFSNEMKIHHSSVCHKEFL
jgi:hypothetical protein